MINSPYCHDGYWVFLKTSSKSTPSFASTSVGSNVTLPLSTPSSISALCDYIKGNVSKVQQVMKFPSWKDFLQGATSFS